MERNCHLPIAESPLNLKGDLRDPRQAVPLSGSWTGDPSDLIGMDVAVSVTADGQLRD